MKKMLLLALIVIAPNLQAMYMGSRGSAAIASAQRRNNVKNANNHQENALDKHEAQKELNTLQTVCCCALLGVLGTCLYLDGQHQK